MHNWCVQQWGLCYCWTFVKISGSGPDSPIATLLYYPFAYFSCLLVVYKFYALLYLNYTFHGQYHKLIDVFSICQNAKSINGSRISHEYEWDFTLTNWIEINKAYFKSQIKSKQIQLTLNKLKANSVISQTNSRQILTTYLCFLSKHLPKPLRSVY